MEKSINKNWRFVLSDVRDAWRKDYDDTAWREVTLPHDWAVEGEFSRANSSGTGYLPGGTGWYRGSFELPEEMRGSKVTLRFCGIYKNSRVWCNGYYLGQRPNGYISFSYDISHCAAFGEKNIIAIRVEHEDISDSRWYTGSGMTRGVALRIEDHLCFTEEGIVFQSPEANTEHARIALHCEIQNGREQSAAFTVSNALLDGSNVVWQDSAQAVLGAGEEIQLEFSGGVDRPELWLPENPKLYTLCSRILSDDTVISERRTSVGLRTFRFTPDRGFFLNDETKDRKLKGVCIHHDAGCLGAAVPKNVWLRRLRLIREMGANAIRMSHNPHDPALLELCDELGFFVIDEAFDEWEGCKNKWSTGHNVYPPKHEGYAMDFPQWWEKDLRALVRRDRNHPCVMMWSIGNEIDYPNDPYCHESFGTMTGNNDANKPAAERQYNPARPNMKRIVTLARQLSRTVREEDSSRPVTAAVAFPELSSRLGYLDTLDMVGYNYEEQFYTNDHARFPEKPFFGSENSHSFEAWKVVRDSEFIFGQFLWTGIDFLGEAAGWPVHGSMAGHITTAGFPKEEYYFRRSLWLEKPVATIVTASSGRNPFSRRWDYRQGETVAVRCFTNQPEAVLIQNGRECAVGKLSDETGYIEWTVPFETGKIEVNAGEASDYIETAAAPVALHLTPIEKSIQANGEDVAQIEVQLCDGQGRDAYGSELLRVAVTGSGELLSIENGDQADNTAYSAPYRRTFGGQMIIYVRTSEKPGAIYAKVSGERVGETSVEIPVIERL